MMPAVNYVIYGCSCARTIPGISVYRSLTQRKIIVAVIIRDRVTDGNLKRQIKNWTLYTCRLFLLTWIILAFTHPPFSIYIARVNVSVD